VDVSLELNRLSDVNGQSLRQEKILYIPVKLLVRVLSIGKVAASQHGGGGEHASEAWGHIDISFTKLQPSAWLSNEELSPR
jgi:hypothetical protein